MRLNDAGWVELLDVRSPVGAERLVVCIVVGIEDLRVERCVL